jgi:hypothetical protein
MELDARSATALAVLDMADHKDPALISSLPKSLRKFAIRRKGGVVRGRQAQRQSDAATTTRRARTLRMGPQVATPSSPVVEEREPAKITWKPSQTIPVNKIGKLDFKKFQLFASTNQTVKQKAGIAKLPWVPGTIVKADSKKLAKTRAGKFSSLANGLR